MFLDTKIYFSVKHFKNFFIQNLIVIFQKIGCSDKIIQALIEYLINTKSIKLAADIFPGLAEANPGDNILLNNELFSYYCSKIYDESEIRYSNYSNTEHFQTDLFIEQSIY